MVGVRPPKRVYREMYLRTRECAATPEPTSIRPTMTMGTASGGPPVLLRAAPLRPAPVLGRALALAVGLALADAPAVALVLAVALAVALALALPPATSTIIVLTASKIDILFTLHLL
jgi:hypothetical protein